MQRKQRAGVRAIEDAAEGPELAAAGIGRRDFLKALAAAGLAGPLASALDAPPAAAEAPGDFFPDGVKAGDPRPWSGVAWTRVQPPTDGHPVPVLWMLAEDEGFERVVRGGVQFARAAHGHTVKVAARGLRPDRWYHYMFWTRGRPSPMGRLRTAPSPWSRPDRLRYAFASCQQRTESFYVAHRAIAEEGVDFLMHLGDYVYVNDFATLTVDDYRGVYRTFHSNPLLQHLQARVPLVAMWDDGEFYNGVDASGPPERLAAARQAWYEHMPVERLRGDRAYRTFPWGQLARVFMIDVRSYRDPEVPPNLDAAFGLQGQDSRIPPGEQMFAEGRTTLGERQKRWLMNRTRRSRATWKLIGNPYNMNPWKFEDFDTPEDREANPDLMRNGGIYVSNEAWDDYQAERRELMEFFRDQQVRNVVFSSGHTHFYIASELQPDFDDPESPTVAFDFVTGSLTADPDPRTIAPEPILRAGEILIREQNDPYMKLLNLVDQGYTVVDVTPEELPVRFRYIDTFDPDAEAVTGARFRVVAGSDTLEVLPPD